MPIAFLRQLIRFYGDSMQMIVPSYLEFSLGKFVNEQQKIREQFSHTLGGKELPGGQMFSAMEEQARKNIALFSQALTMFNPFGVPVPGAPEAGASGGGEAASAEPAKGEGAKPDLDDMKRQIAEMQRRIESLSRKD